MFKVKRQAELQILKSIRLMVFACNIAMTSLSLCPTDGNAHHNKYQTTHRTHYQFRQNHHPQATGKVYMGREIAELMSFHGIAWLERATREEEEKISRLVEALDLRPGMNLADIGAGSGAIARRVAPRLSPNGEVFAVEIQKEMLTALMKKAKSDGIINIKPVLGRIDHPGLTANSIDLILMVDVYHEFSHPYEMLLGLSQSLKPGGRIALVEYRAEDPKVPIKELHKMSIDQIKKEFGHPEFRLKLNKIDQSLPRQHLVFFEKLKG